MVIWKQLDAILEFNWPKCGVGTWIAMLCGALRLPNHGHRIDGKMQQNIVSHWLFLFFMKQIVNCSGQKHLTL